MARGRRAFHLFMFVLCADIMLLISGTPLLETLFLSSASFDDVVAAVQMPVDEMMSTIRHVGYRRCYLFDQKHITPPPPTHTNTVCTQCVLVHACVCVQWCETEKTFTSCIYFFFFLSSCPLTSSLPSSCQRGSWELKCVCVS